MNSIDWSKAPEGTTHFDPVDQNHLKQEGKVALMWNINDGWVERGWQYPDELSIMPRLIGRPAWNGEGPPPVGVMCDVTTNDGYNWRPMNILFRDEFVILAGEIEGKVDRKLLRLCDADVSYRPIRTPDQVAADEREHKIRNALTSIAKSLADLHESEELTAVAIVEAMIDAGYTKEAS
jgi:hypothetical protein